MAKIYLNSWTSYCYRLKMLSQMSDTVWTRKLLCIYLCVHSWEDVNMSCLIRSKKCSNLYWKDSNNDNGKLWELQYWQHVAILGRLTSYQILYVHLKTSGIVKPLWPTTFKECHPVLALCFLGCVRQWIAHYPNRSKDFVMFCMYFWYIHCMILVVCPMRCMSQWFQRFCIKWCGSI